MHRTKHPPPSWARSYRLAASRTFLTASVWHAGRPRGIGLPPGGAILDRRGHLVLTCGGLLLRPVFQESPAQHAPNIVQGGAGAVQPVEFRESVAIIRAAHRPLDGVAWDYADLVCQDMSSLRMVRATGQGIRGTGANFDRSNLPSAWFKRGELNASRFQFARMDDINLEEANMEGSNLYGAEARNSNLVGATLDAANLAHGDFSGANFSNAHFMLADLRATDFHGANFANAVLQDADISGANFKGARHITQAMLDSPGAVFDVQASPLPWARPAKHSGRLPVDDARALSGFAGSVRKSRYSMHPKFSFR